MRRAIVLVALAGCNQVFDLVPTRSIDAALSDFDNDGVLDDRDNCPTLANSDQANSDGDAFGDACDSCPTVASTSVHDEDHDRVGDVCDVCPGVADFGADIDTDGVGDLCDPLPNNMMQPNHRITFEPFVTMPAEWQSDTTTWMQANDAIAPTAMLATTDLGLKNTAISTSGVWMATIDLEAKTAWDASDSYGIIAVGLDDRASCIVTCATSSLGTKCLGEAVSDGVKHSSVSIAPQPNVKVSLAIDNVGTADCLFGGIDAYNGVFQTNDMQLSVLASPRVRITSFDYVQ